MCSRIFSNVELLQAETTPPFFGVPNRQSLWQAAPKAAGTGAVAAKVLRDTKAMTKARDFGENWGIGKKGDFTNRCFLSWFFGLEPARHQALT